MRFAVNLLERLLLDDKCRYVVSPATDVLETASGYSLRCVMPGLNKDDIRLDLRNNELCLEAASQLDPPAGMQVHALEFCSVSYRLRLALPADADFKSISAEYIDGMLIIELPRKEQFLGKRIEVKS